MSCQFRAIITESHRRQLKPETLGRRSAQTAAKAEIRTRVPPNPRESTARPSNIVTENADTAARQCLSQSTPLPEGAFKRLRCRSYTLGADMRRREFIGALVGGAATARPLAGIAIPNPGTSEWTQLPSITPSPQSPPTPAAATSANCKSVCRARCGWRWRPQPSPAPAALRRRP